MYAVFEDGSRQYQVSEGDLVRVDFRDLEPGQNVEFNKVLLFKGTDGAAQVGLPTLEGMRILGDVVDHPSIKLQIQHFRRRKNYRRLNGHRQWYTAVRIRNILMPGQSPPPPPPVEPPADPAASTPPATT